MSLTLLYQLKLLYLLNLNPFLKCKSNHFPERCSNESLRDGL